MTARENPPKAEQRGARSRTTKGGATKEKILDAAEQLFAEHGFSATTIRDIAGQAAVDLSSMSYHFASKRELFDAVMARRAASWCEVARKALEATIHSKGPAVTVEDVLLAFADVSFDALERGDVEWLSYARLATQRLGPTRDMNAVLASYYAPLRGRYLDILSGLLEHMPRAELEWCFASFESSFGSMVYGHVRPDEITKLRGRYLDQLRRNFIPFCAGGFERVQQLYVSGAPASEHPAATRRSKKI